MKPMVASMQHSPPKLSRRASTLGPIALAALSTSSTGVRGGVRWQEDCCTLCVCGRGCACKPRRFIQQQRTGDLIRTIACYCGYSWFQGVIDYQVSLRRKSQLTSIPVSNSLACLVREVPVERSRRSVCVCVVVRGVLLTQLPPASCGSTQLPQ
jgi:hypothetical protein